MILFNFISFFTEYMAVFLHTLLQQSVQIPTSIWKQIGKGVYNLYFMSKSVDKPKYSGYNK